MGAFSLENKYYDVAYISMLLHVAFTLSNRTNFGYTQILPPTRRFYITMTKLNSDNSKPEKEEESRNERNQTGIAQSAMNSKEKKKRKKE